MARGQVVRGSGFSNANVPLLEFCLATCKRRYLPSRSRIYIKHALLLDPFQEEALFLCGPLVIEQHDVEMVHDAILVREAA